MKFLAVALMACVLPLSAQTFTQQVQRPTAGGARIVLHQPAWLTQRVDARATALPRRVHERDTIVPRREERGDSTPQRPERTDKRSTETETEVNADNLSLHKRYRQRYKMKGFRIQIYAGGNSRAARNAAERQAARIKQLHPNLPVYTHFYSPRWICRVGDFKTRAEAETYLQQFQKEGFGEASIVKTDILVSY